MIATATLTSASAADDAAITGLRDVVGALGDTDYRLIGGMAVTLHLHANAARLPVEVGGRSTADNDIAMKEAQLAVIDLDARLTMLLYERTAGNTWERVIGDDEVAAIDVVVPSLTSRPGTRRVGALTVDALPGVFTAVTRPPTVITLTALLRDRTRYELVVLLPDPLAMVTTKAFACTSRSKNTDWVDLWRCLEIAALAGVGPDAFAGHSESAEAAGLVRKHLTSPNKVVAAQLSEDLSAAAAAARITRIRALTKRIVG